MKHHHDGTLKLSELLLKTLEKVEEQTLYVLQQQAQIDALKSRLEDSSR
jgi:hypothetical protein